jgi:ketosteroid isomerase-like protein
MRRHVLRRLAAAVLGVFVSGCSTGSNAKEQQAALLATDRQWSAVASEGRDLDRIVAFWSDDATIYPAGSPAIRGKRAIRKFVSQSLSSPGFHIAWQPAQAELSADGSLGYTSGANTLSFAGSRGQPIAIAGRYVTVWRRVPGGRWKCVVDIWNAAR